MNVKLIEPLGWFFAFFVFALSSVAESSKKRVSGLNTDKIFNVYVEFSLSLVLDIVRSG